jgi:predicted dehydrogenase
MSPNHRISRREFLRASRNSALVAGAGLVVPNCFLNQTQAATGESPSEFIRVGVIGCGGQGNSNIGGIKKNVIAVCDVDTKNLAATRARVQKDNPGRTVAAYRDYRKLLENKEIDAVLIATPDHWHTLPAIEACLAGKDVYCEKPLTLTIHEGIALVNAVRKNKRVFQTGSQQRSDPKFLKACEYIRSGRIGKVKTVYVGLPGVNYVDTLKKAGKPLTVPDSEPPPELDYEMWLGPAPYRPYNKNRVHYLFRFFWDYSGGQMTNWGAHHLDITQWALGMDGSGPVAIEATAEFDPGKLYEVPKNFHVTYKYASGTVVECDSGGGKYKMGALFEGEKGSIYVNRGALECTPDEILEEPLKDGDVRLYTSNNHHQNWLECIRSRKDPICAVEIGHRSATVCHLGIIAMRTGKKLQWDPAMQQIVGDDETAKWTTKAYRAPWKLPVV